MYQAVIGLEVHLQLDTRSKLFSACGADYFGHAPNSFTDPLTLGLPGTLPTVNARAVELAVMLGLALGCQVEGVSEFHRKNYFYPDAPKNYQLSQYDLPIARGGFLDVAGERVRVRRAHLEDDAGKLIHPAYAPYSLLDLNRAGIPLIELVTEPDLKTPGAARAFLIQLRAIAQALGVSDASPEEGKLRCDVNVSLHEVGEPLGTKVEVKNLNSFKSVARSLEYEIARQTRVLEAGGRIAQDTMGWDEGGQKTFVMRTKEEESDYRYFPEPDLPPLNITPQWVEAVRARMPELPAQKRARYVLAGLRGSDAEHLSQDVVGSRFFDAALGAGADAQKLANWLTGDVAGLLAARGLTLGESRLTPAHLASLVKLVDAATISGRTAKDLLPEVLDGADPGALVRGRGLAAGADQADLLAAARRVIAANPAAVAQVRAGNAKAVNALFGPVMRELGGRARPEAVRAALDAALTEDPKPA